MTLKRKAAVAGAFYPRYKPDLIDIIEESFLDQKFGIGKKFKCENLDKRTVIGGVSPHAGYVYSGACASHTYFNLFKEKIPDSVIVLGTTHTGYRSNAVLDNGVWETPLGDIEIDSELATEISMNSKKIKADESAYIGFPHGREHNIEVQIPFLYYCTENKTKLVPLTIGSMNYKELEEISKDIADVIKSTDKDIVIIASSDMSHHQPSNVMDPKDDIKLMKERDQKVITAFEKNNPKGVFENASSITVCGPQTITTLMLICNNLEANNSEVLKYYTSYEKGGGEGPCDYSVGYFSRSYKNLRIQKQRTMLVLDEDSIKNARITILLLTINIFAYLMFNLGLGEEWVLFLSQINENVFRGEIWRLFTAMFLHGDLGHLFNNMMFLFLFGVGLESNYKKIEFLGIYLLSGLIGNLLTLIILPPYIISLGASGCVFGLLGLAIMSNVSEDKTALLFGAIFMGLFLLQSMGENINTIAHLGGGVIGLLFGYWHNKQRSSIYD